ncbi:unnamed protein product [Eruca vesicaria subsp. sativa]|uniref:NAC domain-containing protein n=1 Tax=Eruca vesicaria subsp. sativa TaxID=29727 RepID=A0ABC8JGM3_ERUVS|nr:unnamed protein product [Eruca vesicaria subsp. sativa]
MDDIVGFGFRPTDEELVGYYLPNKIIGNDCLVQDYINEVNISDFDPWNLRFQSKVKSRDLVWYFFSRRGSNGDRQNRRTSSGFWKITGDPVEVKDQWGTWCGVKGKIGYKRVLVFRMGRSSSSQSTKSDWVMHEYHYTLLPEDQRTYVICRLEYKGHDMNILSANPTDPMPTFVTNATTSGSVVSQSGQGNSASFNTFSDYDVANHGQWFNDDFNLHQPVVSYDDDTHRIWDYVVEENFSHYRPKKPVTGVFVDDSSDADNTDTESTTGNYVKQ